jgi:hypothetical protein
MTQRSDETWERLLRLNADQLRVSIRMCESYLLSPKGIAEFGVFKPLLPAECKEIMNEASRNAVSRPTATTAPAAEAAL